MTFQDLELSELIINAINDKGYSELTQVQSEAIPAILSGRDILGCAHTGSGKTAAFALPILEFISKKILAEGECNDILALILAPTRELAIQIGESFESYGKYLDVKIGVVYGGITPKRHIKVLKRFPNVLVATPGRLLDLMSKGQVNLSKVETFVLDEVDQMLDSRSREDVHMIIDRLPLDRKNIMFSATMPNSVLKLTDSILVNPVKIDDKSGRSDAEVKSADIDQNVYFVDGPDKIELLLEIMEAISFDSVLIFTRTKKKADQVCKMINKQNIRSKAIHGDINQSERINALKLFKSKEVKVLVATDVAARGIDIKGISHVINMNIPDVPETYIHRIGRTARAG
ncbi:MAG: DEAD/DEAH box helicase, partial [Acidaminobacteraceae bacterium]